MPRQKPSTLQRIKRLLKLHRHALMPEKWRLIKRLINSYICNAQAIPCALFLSPKVLCQMLTRRHIRVKVLQSLYAYYHTDEHLLDKQEKFLQYSIGQIKDLHALLLELMVAIRDHARDYLEKKSQKNIWLPVMKKKPQPHFCGQ